ncbi:MAG: PilZ domain-containing protein [Bdellovibrionales bacterium]|nr:PilZ domain-containing protein [Bdellovibrionales bacterium]
MCPNYIEKRKHPRVEARISVSFKSLDDLKQEYTRNISTGGIFLKTDRLLDPNAEIELNIQFPENLGQFKVRGKVARLMTLSHPEAPEKLIFGVGVKFLDPEPKMIEVIEKIISSQVSLKK